MVRVRPLRVDVHEESLPLACGTPFPKPHPPLGQRSDVLQLVIIPHRLSHSSRGVLSCLRAIKGSSSVMVVSFILSFRAVYKIPRMFGREDSAQSLAFRFSAVIVFSREVGALEALCNWTSCM